MHINMHCKSILPAFNSASHCKAQMPSSSVFGAQHSRPQTSEAKKHRSAYPSIYTHCCLTWGKEPLPVTSSFVTKDREMMAIYEEHENNTKVAPPSCFPRVHSCLGIARPQPRRAPQEIRSGRLDPRRKKCQNRVGFSRVPGSFHGHFCIFCCFLMRKPWQNNHFFKQCFLIVKLAPFVSQAFNLQVLQPPFSCRFAVSEHLGITAEFQVLFVPHTCHWFLDRF